MQEALIENNMNLEAHTVRPRYALFSRKYYNDIKNLNREKIYDFCFIGSINSNYLCRKWVIDFAKQYFTVNSIFINTDNEPSWVSLGPFDYTNIIPGFCPRSHTNNQSREAQYRVVSENLNYFGKMCQSKYILCPIGDAEWSFRFYETLMCESLPIVECDHHTYRTIQEYEIKYKYLLYNNINTEIVYDDYINENTQLFEKYHLLNNINQL